MRSRNLKPGFYKNEQLAECSFAARILFTGLWCLADREGRLEDRPKKIKMEIFPADNLEISDLIDELINYELVVQYEVDGRKCLWIPGFLKHQNPHPKEAASELPPPLCQIENTPDSRGINEPCKGNDEPCNYTARNLKVSTSPADVLIPSSLIPSSLIPDCCCSEQPAVDPGEKPTPQQQRLFDCCQKLKAKILERFPHVAESFDVEVDKCVAFNFHRNIGADPALTVWKWFERIRAPDGFGYKKGQSFMEQYGGAS